MGTWWHHHSGDICKRGLQWHPALTTHCHSALLLILTSSQWEHPLLPNLPLNFGESCIYLFREILALHSPTQLQEESISLSWVSVRLLEGPKALLGEQGCLEIQMWSHGLAWASTCQSPWAQWLQLFWFQNNTQCLMRTVPTAPYDHTPDSKSVKRETRPHGTSPRVRAWLVVAHDQKIGAWSSSLTFVILVTSHGQGRQVSGHWITPTTCLAFLILRQGPTKLLISALCLLCSSDRPWACDPPAFAFWVAGISGLCHEIQQHCRPVKTLYVHKHTHIWLYRYT